MRVFVSSTCYDLLDVRAEVAAALTDIGITPVLSDDKLSDFQHVPDVNSIERCLVNLETCEAVVLIVDSRYGGILPDLGISATELEYIRAVEKGIPIYFYVRDRTVAEYSIRKKTGAPIPTAWVKHESSEKLFAFLKRHSDLKREGSNWFDSFTNSIDLKAAIQKRFTNRVSAKRIATLIGENQFPFLTGKVRLVQAKHPHDVFVKFQLTNQGRCPALNLSWHGFKFPLEKADVLMPSESLEFRVLHRRSDIFDEHLNIQYSDFRGVRIDKTFRVQVRVKSVTPSITTIETIKTEYRRIEPLEVRLLE